MSNTTTHKDDDDIIFIDRSTLLIGVLALQGAFEEHEVCLHAIGCINTRQVRTVQDLDDLDGIILPGGESTAMGLIGTTTTTTTTTTSSSSSSTTTKNMWESLQVFTKPIWGTCAGMILLAEQCIGTSAVIQDGQALIGGMNICVARNYFGSQVSSFEMPIPGPPPQQQQQQQQATGDTNNNNNDTTTTSSSSTTSTAVPFPGIFIRAPAILTAGPDVEILGTVIATPCRQAAITLQELDRKIANGENIIKLGVVDALERKNEPSNEGSPADTGSMEGPLRYKSTAITTSSTVESATAVEPKTNTTNTTTTIVLPGAADGTNARKVICAARKNNLLCTAFHPELTNDYRWHEYFVQMILATKR